MLKVSRDDVEENERRGGVSLELSNRKYRAVQRVSAFVTGRRGAIPGRVRRPAGLPS
jgi:hypothetical protein